MKRVSIKTAILIPTLSVLIAGVTIMAITAGLLSSKTATDLTNQLIESKVHEYANEFSELCGRIYGSVTTIVPIVANYTHTRREQSDVRGEVIDILSRALMSNNDIIAMWTCWEPDAFDGNDREYADSAFYDSTGRFVPYLYKEGTGYQIEALVDYESPEAGEYYQGARNSGKPYITDPYNYVVGGVEKSMCSLAIPILENGKVVGVVGVDIDLKDFMNLMNNANILNDGYLFTISPGGLVASHPKEEMQMQRYTVTWMKDFEGTVESVLKSGGWFSASAYSDIADTDFAFAGAGVMIGDTGRYWLVCAAVPQKTVDAPSVSLLRVITIIGVISIVLVGITIIVVVERRLIRLPKLTETAESIALGDIDIEGLNNTETKTRNEITLLERAFYKMIKGVKDQSEVLTRMSRGDYSMKISARSEKDIMNTAIIKMLNNTNQTLSQMNSVAEQVYSGSRQIADSSQSIAEGATEQASVIEELSTSVNEITGKTTENARIAREASVLSKEIKDKAEKGSEQMSLMMQAVGEINEASTQIEKVIKAIDEIAFQTNILALNAAVEAARAGQHGKGFAVVAEEVRNLAAKSAESASDTGNMIENSKSKAKLGLLMAQETAQSLKDIIDGVNRNADIAVKIEQAAGEQAAAIMQINDGIEQVSQVIQQNSAASEENAAASEEMSAQSELLTELTSRFTLGGE